MSNYKINETELKLILNEKLCDIADALLDYYDCCGIRGSSCKVADPNPCCENSQFGKGTCPYLGSGSSGCKFRNCECKLWICETAIKTTDPKCIEGLQTLEKFAKSFGLIRTQLIGEPYSGADKQPKSK